MRIGGLERFSMADYDNHLAATVFTQGCNFRCPYCHNPELVDAHRFEPPIPEDEVLDFLASRRGLLEGVCISGGEPTLHDDLPSFCRRLKAMGYRVKLDTNGTNPDMLALLIHERLVDYIAMDYKAPLAKYRAMVRMRVDTEAIRRSVKLLRDTGIDHELRTTWFDLLLEPADVLAIQEEIAGCRRFTLQRCRPDNTLEDLEQLRLHPRTGVEEAVEMMKKEGVSVGVR
ncbi:MAG: anaerobic ribonucleoside-triphosphate reductase activating protein [Candidatus Cloacimonetes bacterium]|nr:anaerobic ribonucleoside-triphosphate reductase activating protein [Candidatus Cloacimonadota bacterium]